MGLEVATPRLPASPSEAETTVPVAPESDRVDATDNHRCFAVVVTPGR